MVKTSDNGRFATFTELDLNRVSITNGIVVSEQTNISTALTAGSIREQDIPKLGCSFSTTSTTLNSSTFFRIPIVVSPAGTAYDAGSNRIGFPTQGKYVVNWTSIADLGEPYNEIRYRIVNTSTNQVRMEEQGHIVGTDFVTSTFARVPEFQFNFVFQCISPSTERLSLEVRHLNNSVTNWSVVGDCVRLNSTVY